jgi:hypothetical protein
VPQLLAPAVRTRVPQNWLRDRAAVSAVAWEPTSTLDCAEWILHGQRLGSIGRGINWWIGDWVNYGNEKFGEKYSRAARITGYDAQTLMNMAYVASRFAPTRRRDALSWSHHAEVSALDPAGQDALLDYAEQAKLSVRGLREEVRARHGKPSERKKKANSTEPRSVCPNCGCQLADNHDEIKVSA